MKPKLVFVYNADSGLFAALVDRLHRYLSPQTYACKLCALTYPHFGMDREWKRFLKDLDHPVEFLHRDELKERHGVDSVPLPAIFMQQGEHLDRWIDATAINACRTIDDLKQCILSKH